jgi:hypothetical protein
MQTLKVCISLPDGSQQPNGWSTHPDIELRLSASDSDCGVVIALPRRPRSEPVAVAEAGSSDAASRAHDDYVLGGYAGI